MSRTVWGIMYVVSYDIHSDKIRNKVAKILEGYGVRVQYSVFECRLSQRQYEQMYEKLVLLSMDTGENGIRIYHLCGKCEKGIKVIGNAENVLNPEEEDLFVV
ncbi:MAG: CRISPR-associated endonuclease Cas2 [Eubacteriales bacterium]|nr:CRISPR-associated endonuclease Cas2 [Eubacteriales bacterium]